MHLYNGHIMHACADSYNVYMYTCHTLLPIVGAILLELDLDELSKAAAVIVGKSLSITKCLQNEIHGSIDYCGIMCMYMCIQVYCTLILQ